MARASWYLTGTVRVVGRRPRLDAQGNPVRDKYGNDVMDEVERDVPGCSWDPRLSVNQENVESAQQTVSGLTLVCEDPDVGIRETDAIRVDGNIYEVDGEVGRFKGTRLGNDHAVIALRRVRG